MPDYSNLFVVLMGLGTVFAGLLCIILLVTLMSWVCNRTGAPKAAPQAAAAPCGHPRRRHRDALHDGRHFRRHR